MYIDHTHTIYINIYTYIYIHVYTHTGMWLKVGDNVTALVRQVPNLGMQGLESRV
jgi:hypothetical protein